MNSYEARTDTRERFASSTSKELGIVLVMYKIARIPTTRLGIYCILAIVCAVLTLIMYAKYNDDRVFYAAAVVLVVSVEVYTHLIYTERKRENECINAAIDELRDMRKEKSEIV